MKTFAALLLIAFMTAGSCAENNAKQTQFAWRDFQAGLKEAQKTNKMILVDIYTDW